MSGRSARTSPPPTPLFEPPPIGEEMEKGIEATAQELLKDSQSLDAMRNALGAAISYLHLRQIEQDRRGAGLLGALDELDLALAMASQGDKHPSLEVKKTRSQCRGRTAAQRGFLERCLGGSNALVAMGHTRREADEKVRKWAKKSAKRLKLALDADDALKHIRKRLRWCSKPNPFLKLDQTQEYDRECLQWWVDTYQHQIEAFEGRNAYRWL
jgi:hypothetical protein